jgi:hypothetical protein
LYTPYGATVVRKGRIDPGGARYDGSYVYDENAAQADVLLKVTFPQNAQSVLDPYEWSIDVRARFDPKQDTNSIASRTYWITNLSPAKGVVHHAILDIGRRVQSPSRLCRV